MSCCALTDPDPAFPSQRDGDGVRDDVVGDGVLRGDRGHVPATVVSSREDHADLLADLDLVTSASATDASICFLSRSVRVTSPDVLEVVVAGDVVDEAELECWSRWTAELDDPLDWPRRRDRRRPCPPPGRGASSRRACPAPRPPRPGRCRSAPGPTSPNRRGRFGGHVRAATCRVQGLLADATWPSWLSMACRSLSRVVSRDCFAWVRAFLPTSRPPRRWPCWWRTAVVVAVPDAAEAAASARPSRRRPSSAGRDGVLGDVDRSPAALVTGVGGPGLLGPVSRVRPATCATRRWRRCSGQLRSRLALRGVVRRLRRPSPFFAVVSACLRRLLVDQEQLLALGDLLPLLT